MRRWLAGLGLLLVLLGGSLAGLLQPDLQQQWLRPRLAAWLGTRLDAEVRLGRLHFTLTRLQLDDVVIARRDGTRLDLPRLAASWSWNSLRRRQLETLGLERPVLHWQPATGSGSPVELPAPLPLRQLTLSNGRLAIADLPWRAEAIQLRLDAGGVRLRARVGTAQLLPLALDGRLRPGPTLPLQLERLTLDGAPLLAAPLELSPSRLPDGVRLRLPPLDRNRLARWLAAAGHPDLLPGGLDFTLTAPTLELRPAARELALQLAGATLRWQDRQLPLGAIDLHAAATGDGWRLRGRAALPAAGSIALNGSWRDGAGKGEATLTLPDVAALAAVSGQPLPLRGSLSGTLTAHVVTDGVALHAHLTGGEAGGTGLRFAGLTLTADASRQGENWQTEATLAEGKAELLHVEGDGSSHWSWRLPPQDGRRWQPRLPAAWRPPGLEQLHGLTGNGELKLTDSGLSGRYRLTATAATVGPAALSALSAAGRWRWRPAGWQLVCDRFGGKLGGDGLPTGAFSARGTLSGGKRLRLQLRQLAVTGLEYLSADGLSGLSGGRLDLHGSAGAADGGWDFSLDGRAAVRELLRGAFYAKTAALPADLHLDGRWTGPSWQLHRFALTVAGLGQAELSGTGGSDHLALRGTSHLEPLDRPGWQPLWQGVQGLGPLTAGLALHGTLAADAALTRQGSRWQLDGLLHPNGLGLYWPSARLDISGLRGALPFHLGSADAPPAVETGRLELADAKLALARLSATSLTLEAGRNRLRLPGKLRWQLAGGSATLTDTEFDHLTTAPGFAADIRVDRVNLADLTADLGWPPMAGDLSADLGRIRYQGGALASDGSARIDAFGGTMRIGAIRARDLLGNYPVLQADLAFRGIDLARLTRTFSFGEMHGIVDGDIRQLRLFGATPSHFVARLESRTTGRRDISVKALNNLSVLSQGSFMSVLGRGLYRFIDFYRYRKLGLYCRLENDRFQLRGTAGGATGHKLVDGGWLPPKIDIIAPEGDISFKEMLRRLQRIDRSGS